jgi:hypothetical protein
MVLLCYLSVQKSIKRHYFAVKLICTRPVSTSLYSIITIHLVYDLSLHDYRVISCYRKSKWDKLELPNPPQVHLTEV